MRPITLKMAGLRSYRAERTIDFGDPGLIAVIGDTGAGKSSILEGLTGALYGACTWDNRGIGELINDGAKTVQVELIFAVAGQIWTISRSASRNNYPPSRHFLHCHDTGEKLTGERAVTARVTSLLGLDTKQFLRVVVLPQNRFMELLNARRGERNTILKGIFRLEDLDRVRQAAETLRDDLEPKLTQARIARGKLADNPAEQLTAARARRLSAEQDKDRLHRIREQVTAHQEASAALDQAAARLQSSRDQLTSARSRTGDINQALAAAASSAADLDSRAAALARQRENLQTREAAAQQALDTAAAVGEDTATLATAAQTLDTLAQAVPALVADRQALITLDRKVARQAAGVAALREQLHAKDAELNEADQGLNALQEEAAQTQQVNDEARQALTILSQALESATLAAAHTDQQRRSLTSLRGTARGAIAKFQQAAGDAQQAEAELQEVRRQNSAAHAAQACQPRDPCPICRRPLPDGFTPPTSADEATASAHADEQRAAALQADRAASTATEQARRAANDLADALDLEIAALIKLGHAATSVTEHAGAVSAAVLAAHLASATSALAAEPVVGEPAAIRAAADDLTPDSPIDLVPAARRVAMPLVAAVSNMMADGIDQLVEPLNHRAVELRRHYEQARSARDQLNMAVAGLQARANERSDAIAQEQEHLADSRDDLITRATHVAEQLGALPSIAADIAQAAALTPVPLASLTPALSRDQAAAEQPPCAPLTVALPDSEDEKFAASFQDAIGQVAARVQEKLRTLAGHQRDLREAHKDLGSLSRDEQSLTRERAANVSRPIRQVTDALQTIHTRASDLLQGLSQATDKPEGVRARTEAPAPELPCPPNAEEVITAELVNAYLSATTVFLAAVDRLTGNASQVLASLEESAATQRQAITEVLATSQLTDIAGLQQAEIDAATQWEIADQDTRRYSAEQPVAEALGKGIADATAAVAVLRAVAKALTSTQFVDYVIARRSTALLLVASKLLGQLTGDAYGFTEDFQIINRQTRTERDVKTLSGGETFLASLALALGLVELAGRSGGRIDSLFLDEGFGSLDTTILAEALDVLRSHVSTGRLVAVISHLHAVAADLDRVLLVTKNPTGSDLRWLQPVEREQLLLDDVSAGLLT
jgi:DNA repair protein SbcC/Rad50